MDNLSQTPDYIATMGANLCWSGNHHRQLVAAADNGDDLAAAVLHWLKLTTCRGRKSDQIAFNAACERYRKTVHLHTPN